MDRTSPDALALAYPSPYAVAMSSLGFQTIYREVQASDRFSAVRFFAPDRSVSWGQGTADLGYESGLPLDAYRVVAFSIAYELELGHMLAMLNRARVPLLRSQRADSHPMLILGGPLTTSNPRPLSPFADAIVVGDADDTVIGVLEAAFRPLPRARRLEALAAIPSVWVPSIHGSDVPDAASCTDRSLPAWGPIRTPHAELRDMFLIEAVRGCSRACHYCVMRGRKGRGMRIVPAERILERIPGDEPRVGLVGASVSDHPDIIRIVETLASRGTRVGLSSLRPERLRPRFVEALKAGGYRTVTTALDGPSQRLRDRLERKTTAEHVLEATRVCRETGVERLKLYVMVGLPGETLEDIDECVGLVRELSKLLPTSLGVSPFCAKRGTPMESAPFAGTDVVERHIKHLRRGIAGKAEVKATSVRWSWIEHVLSAGGEGEGLAVMEAEASGGSFSDYRRAFEALGHAPSSR